MAETSSVMETVASEPRKALVVDDDPSIQTLISILLTKKGFKVATAGDGKTAIKEFCKETPDIVLLDIDLPDISGLEVSRKLAVLSDPWPTPIILVTGKDSQGDMIKGLQGPVVDYVTKPFHPAHLLARVENAIQAHHRYKKASMIDHLTGLSNYHCFKEQITYQFRYSRRYKSSFSLIMMDIDRFKAINDTYGHHTGDVVLRETARKLIELVRSVDILMRYGGDEFTILMPRADTRGAAIVLRRLMQQVRSFPVKLDSATEIQVGMSFGCATYSTRMKNENDIFVLADQRLYVDKKKTRKEEKKKK